MRSAAQNWGNLSLGASANIALLELENGNFGFVDAWGARMEGSRRLVYELTVRNGKVVYDRNGITRQSWGPLGNYQAPKEPWWDETIP
jgi:dihydroorotase